jgi:pimeloyl-ACP methyl ester carboxylesterase
MAEDARRFTAALGFTAVDVLGYSLGGFVAQQLIAAYPNPRAPSRVGSLRCKAARSICWRF